MIKINKKVEYALMVLKLMSDRDETELTSAREVCEMFKTPFDTTSKVMQIMNNAGILSSVQGVKEYNVNMAATLLTGLVPLVIYFASGKLFVRGILSLIHI